ncbi:DUF86 domain-containing protein [ANME-2 cluster archaeon]|nr:MAG: DUF86 domain-containing protein [ANME-2 cluster archaeon]
MRRERCLEKLELFEEELDFVGSHDICDDVTERALLHSLQTCVEISMDIVAMLTKDAGLVVEDDYTNIEKLSKGGIISADEKETLNGYNGLRNSIVHRYNRLDMGRVAEGLDGAEKLYRIVAKLASIYESVSAK